MSGLSAEEHELLRARAARGGVDSMILYVDWLIAARETAAERRGAERALREAAKELPGFDGIRTHGDAARWLRDRADALTPESTP